MSIKWKVLDQISGSGIAEILKGLLEAQGISVFLSQEGIGETIYPVTVGPLSEIQILVPSDQFDEANKILDEYYAGKFEDLSYPPDAEQPASQEPEED